MVFRPPKTSIFEAFNHLIHYYDKFKKSFEQEAVLRNLSERTRKSYWWHIVDYSKFCKKDPLQTDVKELRAYFQSMLTDGNHKPGSVKMGYYALRFLFTNIYHKEWAKEYLPTPKVAKTLPLVLSKDEVVDVLNAIDNFKHRIIIMLIYSTGARVSESVNLKPHSSTRSSYASVLFSNDTINRSRFNQCRPIKVFRCLRSDSSPITSIFKMPLWALSLSFARPLPRWQYRHWAVCACFVRPPFSE